MPRPARARNWLRSDIYRAASLGANSGADPKVWLAEYRLYENAQTALYNRRLPEAAALLRQLLAADPPA